MSGYISISVISMLEDHRMTVKGKVSYQINFIRTCNTKYKSVKLIK